MVGFLFQTDDTFLLVDVVRKGGSPVHIDDAVNEESDIRHEFEHPRRIRSLIDGPLQDVGFPDAFEKVIKVLLLVMRLGSSR